MRIGGEESKGTKNMFGLMALDMEKMLELELKNSYLTSFCWFSKITVDFVNMNGDIKNKKKNY